MSVLSKRMPTIVGLLILVVGIVGGIIYVNSKRVNVGEENSKPQQVRITNVADNKFSVSWTTKVSSSGSVIFGKTGESISTEVLDDRDLLSGNKTSYTTHHITVEGLQPSTRYAFRVVSDGTQFDNNGSSYSVTTGPVIANPPPAETVYGKIQDTSTLPAEGALVYVSMPGSVPLSTLVKVGGNFTIPISTARTADLQSYVSYDPISTVISMTITNSKQTSQVSTNIANAAPVPDVILGNSYDFTTETPAKETIAVIEEGEATPSGSTTPGVFNVEPLGNVDQTSEEVEIINPSDDGEIVSTSKPEFLGTGEPGLVLTITVESDTTYNDTLVVDDDGEWRWPVPGELNPGNHTLTISFVDTEGIKRILRRNFVVLASDTLPAFEATPSASTSPTPSPSPSLSPSPSPSISPSPSSSAVSSSSATPKSSIPSTQSGVPVTGVLTPTMLTAVLGFVIMVTGALLLVL